MVHFESVQNDALACSNKVSAPQHELEVRQEAVSRNRGRMHVKVCERLESFNACPEFPATEKAPVAAPGSADDLVPRSALVRDFKIR